MRIASSSAPVGRLDFRLALIVVVDPERLSELEREVLELCSMSGETSTTLHEEMLESPPDRATLESTLRGLASRGLMRTERGVYVGVQRSREATRASHRVYEGDWWDVTPAGRRAIGIT